MDVTPDAFYVFSVAVAMNSALQGLHPLPEEACVIWASSAFGLRVAVLGS